MTTPALCARLANVVDRNGSTTSRKLTQRRNPFELWIVVTCALTGLVALLPFGGPRQGVVDRYLPVLALPWYVGLLVGGCIAALGGVWRARSVRSAMRGLALERIGLIILSGLTFGYGGALVATALRAPTGTLLVGFAVAAGIRVYQISRELRAIEHALQDAWSEEDTT